MVIEYTVLSQVNKGLDFESKQRLLICFILHTISHPRCQVF